MIQTRSRYLLPRLALTLSSPLPSAYPTRLSLNVYANEFATAIKKPLLKDTSFRLGCRIRGMHDHLLSALTKPAPSIRVRVAIVGYRWVTNPPDETNINGQINKMQVWGHIKQCRNRIGEECECLPRYSWFHSHRALTPVPHEKIILQKVKPRTF